MDREALIADGWTQVPLGGFAGMAGPFWSRGTGPGRTIGFLAEERHNNDHMLTVHGGMLMTFVDNAFGLIAADAIGGVNCVTAQIQFQFVAAAPIGDFFTCTPEIIRQSKHLIFLRGLVRSGETTVASADGIWKVFPKAK